MRKWILFFVAFAFTVFLSFASYLYLYRAEFASAELSKLYGVPVKISKIKVSSKDIELKNITVYNPTEFVMQPALTVAKIQLKMTPMDALTSLFSFDTSIRKINIVDLVVGLEMNNESGTENNWNKLLFNMTDYIDNTPSSRYFTVDEICIRDIAIDIRNKSVHKHTKRSTPINQILLSPLPETPGQSIDTLIYWITRHALQEIGQKSDQPGFSNAINLVSIPDGAKDPLKVIKN